MYIVIENKQTTCTLSLKTSKLHVHCHWKQANYMYIVIKVFNDNVHAVCLFLMLRHCGIFSFPFISWIFYHIHLHQYLSFIFTGIFFPQIKFFDVTDDTTLILQWPATGWWFSPGTPVSSTNKTDCHDITEILLKVALNTINQTL
jgi:hypothetical protein